MEYFNYVLILFAIYSFLGWILETSFFSINERKIITGDF